MTRVYPALKDHQLGVLRWVADGCPDGVMDGYSYKTIAIALQSRRLIAVSKKGGKWQAAATDAGHFYLEYGNYQPAAPFHAKSRAADADSPPLRRRQQTERRSRPTRRPDRRPKAPSPTEQLVADLVANGEIKVSGADRAKYEARVAAAIRFGKVPEGKQIVVDGNRWSREYVVRLRDAPAWLTATLEPIPVPATLRRPHPVVTALQAEKRLMGLDRFANHRALLLIQALAAEAERRGYVVKEAKVAADVYGYQYRKPKEHLFISIGRHSVGMEFRQEMKRTPHEPTPAEKAKAARHRWYRIPKYDVVPSDRLSAHLSGRFEHRQSKWTDGTTGRLEGGMAQILQEIELRAEAAEQERLAAIDAAEQRRRQWERAMDQAKDDYAEAYRADVLTRQIGGWVRARQVRSYLEVMQATIDAIVDADDAVAAKEWHRWAEEWAATVDPLAQPLAMPAVPEPKPDDLQPFLNGWNPHGPDR